MSCRARRPSILGLSGLFELSVLCVLVSLLGACGDELMRRPLIPTDDRYDAREDTPLSVVSLDGLLGNDGGDDRAAPNVLLAGAPLHGQLTLELDGSFTYVPAPDFAGDDSYSYELLDGEISKGTASVALHVEAVNDPPAARDDHYVLSEDTALNLGAADGVLANDTDVDGDKLSVTVITPPASGALVLGTDGALVYQPAADFSGTDMFRYQLSDGVESRQATVQLQVTPVNDPPLPANDSYTLAEDTTLTVPAATGVLANDLDLDGDALAASVVTPPASGTLTLGADGSIQYLPNANFNGTDRFTYAVTDGEVSSQAQVQLQVTPVNDPPFPLNDSYSVDEDTTLTVPAATGVLANDSDVDGDTLTASVVTPPTSGTLTLGSNGSISYQPAANFFGSVSFRYQVSDGALTQQAQVQLTVNPRNDLPVAQAGTAATTRNAPVQGQLVASDVDGDALTFALATPPAHGQVTITAATGAFTYTPQTNYVGSDSFTFTASDAVGASAPAQISITVSPPPLPAIATLYPAFGTTGLPLQIAGTTFGAAAGSVTIGGVAVPIATWTDRLVVVTVPAGLAAGGHNVVVTDAAARSSAPVSYDVRPWIVDIEPRTPAANDVITITGDSFGATPGTVDLGGAPGTVQTWVNDRVTVRVPAGAAGHARVRLTTAALQPSNASSITRRGSDLWLPSPVPAASQSHNAFWTGSDMIVWGTRPWRYEPRGDKRIPMATAGAPGSGVGAWIGTQLVVYGTGGGARYDAFEDAWTPISTTGMPAGGPAVWTGSQLLVWGATLPLTPNAARFDPVANAWFPISTVGAPTTRYEHVAVWTGTELFVWGGYDGSATTGVANGALYNPATNTWRPVTTVGAPGPRRSALAVWTGTRVIVWGGADPNVGINTGGIYDPATDTWTAMTTVNAPAGRRESQAVWTGTRMVVWGGYNSNQLELDTGGSYDPATNTWAPLSDTGKPQRRSRHSIAWTGIDLIVWGGIFSSSLQHTGGIYTPGSDSWSPMLVGVPSATRGVAWTGSELVLLGEASGRFDPVAETWGAVDSSTQVRAAAAPTVWTGTEAILWGGFNGVSTLEGVRYRPSTDTWAATSLVSPPAARHHHVGVWSGSEMIVWGGFTGSLTSSTNGSYLNTGSRYAPATNTWVAMTTSGAPAPRRQATGVWTGSELLVWGGWFFSGTTQLLATGGRYRPSPEQWTPMSTVSVPTARRRHVAVWTGSQLLIWGGEGPVGVSLASGGRYNPTTDAWTPMSTVGAPMPRVDAVAAWTGNEMVVWGGFGSDGGAYNPATDTWRAISLTGAPAPLSAESAVWTGREVIVWGKDNDVGIYVP